MRGASKISLKIALRENRVINPTADTLSLLRQIIGRINSKKTLYEAQMVKSFFFLLSPLRKAQLLTNGYNGSLGVFFKRLELAFTQFP